MFRLIVELASRLVHFSLRAAADERRSRAFQAGELGNEPDVWHDPYTSDLAERVKRFHHPLAQGIGPWPASDFGDGSGGSSNGGTVAPNLLRER